MTGFAFTFTGRRDDWALRGSGTSCSRRWRRSFARAFRRSWRRRSRLGRGWYWRRFGWGRSFHTFGTGFTRFGFFAVEDKAKWEVSKQSFLIRSQVTTGLGNRGEMIEASGRRSTKRRPQPNSMKSKGPIFFTTLPAPFLSFISSFSSVHDRPFSPPFLSIESLSSSYTPFPSLPAISPFILVRVRALICTIGTEFSFPRMRFSLGFWFRRWPERGGKRKEGRGEVGMSSGIKSVFTKVSLTNRYQMENVKIWVHDGIPFFTLIYYCLT